MKYLISSVIFFFTYNRYDIFILTPKKSRKTNEAVKLLLVLQNEAVKLSLVLQSFLSRGV